MTGNGWSRGGVYLSRAVLSRVERLIAEARGERRLPSAGSYHLCCSYSWELTFQSKLGTESLLALAFIRVRVLTWAYADEHFDIRGFCAFAFFLLALIRLMTVTRVNKYPVLVGVQWDALQQRVGIFFSKITLGEGK
jgi:hypothetical protein